MRIFALIEIIINNFLNTFPVLDYLSSLLILALLATDTLQGREKPNVVRPYGNQRSYPLSGKPSFALAPPYDFSPHASVLVWAVYLIRYSSGGKGVAVRQRE
ncbi:MAG: hypothetical protein PUP92_33230 [Rhizonema sp. PD38]|nr:hypothetical protein [Rhizonema sp. PD38]